MKAESISRLVPAHSKLINRRIVPLGDFFSRTLPQPEIKSAAPRNAVGEIDNAVTNYVRVE